LSGTISLSNKVDYPISTNPSGGAIADLDGDGKLDICIPNSGDSSISVLKNTSSANVIAFAPHIKYRVGNQPLSVSIADLDNDGKPDIVVPNRSDSTFSVLRNQTSEPIITSYSPSSGGAGTLVTIFGRNLLNVTSVSFGGTSASGFIAHSDSLITAIVGQGSSGSVSAVNPFGTQSKSGFTFTPLSSNIISGGQTICMGETIDTLIGSIPQGGNNSYSFSWLISLSSDSSGYTIAPGRSDTINYFPSILNADAWYRRVVISGGVRDTSNAIRLTINPMPTATATAAGYVTEAVW
jgi:hypothetical protein